MTSTNQPLLLPSVPSLGGLPLELFQLIINHLEGDQAWYAIRDLDRACRAFHKLFTDNDRLRAQYERARVESHRRLSMVLAALQTSSSQGLILE